MPLCAFLSTDDLEGYVVYDELAYPAFAELGWQVRAVPWRAETDWAAFDLVILRSCWDYQQDADRFLELLERIDAATRLENPLRVVRWNLRKDYLRDLESRGADIVPTLWREAGSGLDASWFEELGSDRLVLKPLISANAEHTHVLDRRSLPGRRAELEAVFEARPFLVQPFMPAITEEGELSLFYFGGQLSHAIMKKPARGDFRVQEEHGGLITAHRPTAAMLAAAERCLETVGQQLLYARVDLVRDHSASDDRYLLMELELIEPSLYFPFDPASPARFARAATGLFG